MLCYYLSPTVEFVLSCECYQWRNIMEGETRNSAIAKNVLSAMRGQMSGSRVYP